MNRTPFYEQVRDRLLRYARVDTQSARTSDTVPTTKKQFDLAYMLRDELNEIGAADVWLDEKMRPVRVHPGHRVRGYGLRPGDPHGHGTRRPRRELPALGPYGL